jgi:hypothetical protein
MTALANGIAYAHHHVESAHATAASDVRLSAPTPLHEPD